MLVDICIMSGHRNKNDRIRHDERTLMETFSLHWDLISALNMMMMFFTAAVPVKNTPLSSCASCDSAFPVTSWNQSHIYTLISPFAPPARVNVSNNVGLTLFVPDRRFQTASSNSGGSVAPTFQVAGFRRMKRRVVGSCRWLFAARTPTHAVSKSPNFKSAFFWCRKSKLRVFFFECLRSRRVRVPADSSLCVR